MPHDHPIDDEWLRQEPSASTRRTDRSSSDIASMSRLVTNRTTHGDLDVAGTTFVAQLRKFAAPIKPATLPHPDGGENLPRTAPSGGELILVTCRAFFVLGSLEQSCLGQPVEAPGEHRVRDWQLGSELGVASRSPKSEPQQL